jgi:hypothetical protein
MPTRKTDFQIWLSTIERCSSSSFSFIGRPGDPASRRSRQSQEKKATVSMPTPKRKFAGY